MLRRTPLLVRTGLSAIALLATGLLLRADDPPAPTPPPGYKVIYQDTGDGKKAPIFVQDQFDPLRHAGNIGADPLDHQKVFSETNPESNKTFLPGEANGLDKVAAGSQQTFDTRVYNSTAPTRVYNLGSKNTFQTGSYSNMKAATGYDQTFGTKSASPDLDRASTAFAPLGSPDQNRTAPIDQKTYPTYASPEQDLKFTGPEADAIHKHLTKLSNGQTLVQDIPDRPLTIDEVKNLINHGFKPNLSQPPAPASKPLNDPNFQPEPLRIEPTAADDAPMAPGATPTTPPPGHKDEDDANDPVPSPGTMADPPENAEPLPKK